MLSNIPSHALHRSVFTLDIGLRQIQKIWVKPRVAGIAIAESSSRRDFSSMSLHRYPNGSDRNQNNTQYHRRDGLRYPPIRWYPSTTKGYSSSTILGQSKSGEEHHSFFREQLLELEKEQRRFGLVDDENGDETFHEPSQFPSPPKNLVTSASSPSAMEEDLREWESEQLEVFGEALADPDRRSDESGKPTSTGNSTELDPEDREARFEFTTEEVETWGKPTPSPGDMQSILEEIALEREKEAAYEKSASLSPSSDGNDNSKFVDPSAKPSTNDNHLHHESFSHVSEDGSGVHMVDVGHKAVTARKAHARSEVWLPQEVLEAFSSRDDASSSSKEELVGPKGPIFATAKIAGIMACKKTSDLIPLCHPLPLDQVTLDIALQDNGGAAGGTVVIDCTCKVTHKTGVEMEALTGATVAALTIYDMTKAVSHSIRIRDTRLVGKTGGKRTVTDGIEGEVR